jgi:hypothetical protein
MDVINTIYKSQYFFSQNKQIYFVFIGSTGVSTTYPTQALLSFYMNALYGVPVSYYTNPNDQEIYTIFVCRDFFVSLLQAVFMNQEYFAQGKQFCYVVELPTLLYPTASPRTATYCGNSLLNIYYSTILP